MGIKEFPEREFTLEAGTLSIPRTDFFADEHKKSSHRGLRQHAGFAFLRARTGAAGVAARIAVESAPDRLRMAGLRLRIPDGGPQPRAHADLLGTYWVLILHVGPGPSRLDLFRGPVRSASGQQRAYGLVLLLFIHAHAAGLVAP